MAVLSATRLAPVASQIVHPKWSAQMSAAQRTLQGEKLQAETEEQRGRAAWMNAQAEEGKGRYLKVGNGVFDQQVGQWATPPTDKSNLVPIDADLARERGLAPLDDGRFWVPASVAATIARPVRTENSLEVTPERGKELGIVPDANGKYFIPKEGIGPFVTGQGKPDPRNPLTAVTLAVKAAGGDPSNPSSITPEIAKRAGELLRPQMPGIELTPEAVKFWAQAASQGVPLPSMGMGASGAKARQQIINAAPGESGGNTLVANRATQRASTLSLQNIVKMRDSVLAFENTAKRNLDVFLQTAKPIVDAGSPWANVPLRSVASQGLGSADLAAFNAARQVALTEIAKVVNNPSLSSVLSDTARKEVLSLLPENATLAQIYRVAGVLQLDMANRKIALDQMIGEVENRLSVPPGQEAPPPMSPPASTTTLPSSSRPVVWTRDAHGNPVRR